MSNKDILIGKALEDAQNLKSLRIFIRVIQLAFGQYRLADLNTRTVGFTANSPILESDIPVNSRISAIQAILERACRMSFPGMRVDIFTMDEEGETFYLEFYFI